MSPTASPHKPTFCLHQTKRFTSYLEEEEQEEEGGGGGEREQRQIGKEMKLVWSAETATKAYIDTVKCCEIYQESGVAELVAAMAAGWNAKLVVETFTLGGVITTSIGLSIASRHTDGRHVCVVPDERTGSEYAQAMKGFGMEAEVIVGEAEEVMERLTGIDFLVVDCRQKDFSKVLRFAKLGNRGAVVACKNASSRNALNFRLKSVVEGGCSRRVVRSVFLPVGKGLDIAHVAAAGDGAGSGLGKGRSRWVKHIDRRSGEEHVIRR